LHRPEIRECPVAVGGSAERRHGIILTANAIAAEYGVKTAEPIWQAMGKCPNLIVVPPNYPLYVRFSGLVKNICKDYTDKVESFGLDESWLDVTDNVKDIYEGEKLAHTIRERINFELGITVSIGVSWNKIFSKLGSDYKKPDAVTVFSKENFKERVFPLPCRDLLYVGPATERKLRARGIFTIGDIAAAGPDELCSFLGKNGYMLYAFAAGLENSPVRDICCERGVKSVGNAVTAPRDLVNYGDVKLTFTVLAESVARRLRDQGLRTQKIGISVRDSNLNTFTRQTALPSPSASAQTLIKEAMKLFCADMEEPFKVRSVGICAFDLCSEDCTVQFDLFGEVEK
ncbi:MAG: DNA polymerase IV, partial [Acutalibacteraceae bacterium]|nr:DNA polymerase IV [Acutalibacteraceae bacterium]